MTQNDERPPDFHQMGVVVWLVGLFLASVTCGLFWFVWWVAESVGVMP